MTLPSTGRTANLGPLRGALLPNSPSGPLGMLASTDGTMDGSGLMLNDDFFFALLLATMMLGLWMAFQLPITP